LSFNKFDRFLLIKFVSLLDDGAFSNKLYSTVALVFNNIRIYIFNQLQISVE
jgi:hypothetical protein